MNKMPIRIAITGTNGLMGRSLVQVLAQSQKMVLSAALCRSGSASYGVDAGELAGIGALGIVISDDLQAVENNFDILIDFTCPEASLAYLDFCRRQRKGMVIGTTGFSETQRATIVTASMEIGIVFSPNFSVGINLMLKLLEKVATAMGEEADIEIIEAHHRNKVDAPSATALAMGEIIAIALGHDFSKCAVYSRNGHIGERQKKSIGFATVRAGDIIGEHTVLFAKCGERLEISHKASNRLTFAHGAVRAAAWLSEHKQGLFNMENVLSFNE